MHEGILYVPCAISVHKMILVSASLDLYHVSISMQISKTNKQLTGFSTNCASEPETPSLLVRAGSVSASGTTMATRQDCGSRAEHQWCSLYISENYINAIYKMRQI